MDRASYPEFFLAYRISRTEVHCIEGWTGTEWKPECYVRSDQDAVIHLLLHRNEGADVELARETIEHTLHILKANAKHIEQSITILEAALQNKD